MYSSTIALLAALAASAIAKTIPIDVGKSGLVFSPDTTTAAVGDILEFHFYASPHTVVQGDFSTPCQVGSLGTSGFGSGPVKGQADGSTVFQVTVKSTDPIWYYCSIPGHCSAGMVGVINPPSSGNSLDGYRSAAKSASSAQDVSTAQGGTIATAGSGSSAASASATAAVASGSSTPAPTATGSGTSAPSSVSASQTKASSTASATAAATTTSGGMALMETSEKIALTSVLVGLGLLVMLMV